MGHPVFARLWARLVAPSLQRQGGDELRARLLAGLSGRVVEVGAGEGANLDLYPDAVTQVVAVEPEPYLRARAEARGVARARVVAGRAEALPVEDAGADAVVLCLVLCTVPAEAALAEARRVLRPGGRVHFLEHVLDPEPGSRRRLQRRLDRLGWPRLAGGCHLGRDTLATLRGAGFEVLRLERPELPGGRRGPATTAVMGVAVPA